MTYRSKTAKELVVSLQQMKDFDEDLKTVISYINFSTVQDMTSHTRSLWANSTTSYPQLLEAKKCWHSRCLSFEEIFLASLRLSKTSESYQLSFCGCA